MAAYVGRWGRGKKTHIIVDYTVLDNQYTEIRCTAETVSPSRIGEPLTDCNSDKISCEKCKKYLEGYFG